MVGYGTPEHLQGLQRLGPTIHHRRSFAPVRRLGVVNAASDAGCNRRLLDVTYR